MTAPDVWRWTDERGVQRLVGTDELRGALASAILPSNTLVWREGMKEWAAASTVPELASAAFAGADPDTRDPSFDPRSTAERQRRATLVGLPTAAGVLPDGKVPPAPVAVPAPGSRADRPAVTQIPPFGGPTPEPPAVVPAPPRIPATPATARVQKAEEGAAKPKRKITSSEIDGAWATTTRSDEDDTIPRRARPSELAAAAAAAAEATAALRLPKPAGVPATAPAAAPRKPPPPLPAGNGAAGGGARTAPPPHPPPKPAAKSIPPPLPARAMAKTEPGLIAPVLPVGEPVRNAAPAKPAVRIRPPAASGVSIEDLPNEAKPAPFKMSGTGEGVPLSTTLTGVAAVAAAAAEKPAAPAKPAIPPLPPQASQQSTTKITKTLVSPRDALGEAALRPPSLPQIADIADDPSDTAVIPGKQAAKAPPPQGDNAGFGDEITEARPKPVANGAAAPAGSNGVAEAPPAQAVAMAGQPAARATQSSRPPPLPPKANRASQSSRPPPPLPPRERKPEPPDAITDLLPADQLGLSSAALAEELEAQPKPEVPASTPEPPAVTEAETEPRPPEESSSDLSASMRPPPGRLAEQVAVPLSSLVGAGALLIGLVMGAFFVGRASSAAPARLTAHPSLGAVPVMARSTLPAPLRGCWMVKQPARWAPQASRSIPFDAVATQKGTLALGYAADAHQALGIEVDLGSGEVKSRLKDDAHEVIERVVPTPAVEFRVARGGGSGPLRGPIEVPALDGGGQPFAVGLGTASIGLASPPDSTPATLWPLEGEEGLGAAGVRPAGAKGFVLAYRRGGSIWGGFIGADRKASGDLVRVTGSGGLPGKPAVAWNGREVAVIYAEQPEPDRPYEIRVGHASGGIPAKTEALPLPKGGPGGDAFAPEIAGLSDGRWLLMWTEGASGARAVRAQTLAPDFSPLGDPIALSPPAGNYGQGVIGVVGDRAATVFLSKGSASYELWGAVLQCGG